jgi:hypothetical protein
VPASATRSTAYDDLFATAARLHQPVFIHPQIPSNKLRDAAYRGLDPLVDLGLATVGWGWRMDAGTDQVLFSADYPFHRPSAAAVRQFFDAIPDPADRSKVASGNAEALFHLT